MVVLAMAAAVWAIAASLPLSLRTKIESMARHVHAAAAKGHALGLKARTLLEASVPRQADVSPGAQHAMPGDAALGIVQCPRDLPGCARVARGLCYIAIG